MANLTKNATPRLVELYKPVAKTLTNFKRKTMEHLCRQHKLLSIPVQSGWNVSHLGGDKSYVLLGSLARLENALTRWTMDQLVARYHFKPVVVPNILHDHIIDKCGFPTRSTRSQVYKISGNNRESILDDRPATAQSDDRMHACVAGTSEFALAAIHIGDSIPAEELPKKYCALSRCYRAETAKLSTESGIYRVHYFNKVEMFAFSMPDKSAQIHEDFVAIQKDLFKQLGLQFNVLDMPHHELGLSAQKKYDIEAWMPGRERFGEISSTSNCADYQSSRLNIKYSRWNERDGQLASETGFVHTINGTACSTARTLIAISEQHQNSDDSIAVPEPLVPYMNGTTKIPTTEDQSPLKLISPE